MGIKRILFVSLLVVAVLSLIVLLLFQSGVDEKVVDSLLPRIESRLGVQAAYSDIDASLTSLTLNEVSIREREGNCLLARIDKLGVGFRLGPLFVGDVDLTGIRLEGLSIRYGAEAGGCGPAAWRRVVENAEQRAEGRGEQSADEPRGGRPEIYLVSGEILFDDGRFSAKAGPFSGRADDVGKAVFEIEECSLEKKGVFSLSASGGEIRFVPDEKRVRIEFSGGKAAVTDIREKLLEVWRDWELTEAALRGGRATPSTAAASDAGADTDAAGAGFGISLAIRGGEATVSETAHPENRVRIQDLSVDFSVGPSSPPEARAKGRLPGTDASFNLSAKRGEDGLPQISLKVPDVSLASLGPILFATPSVDWTNASLDGEFLLSANREATVLALEGRAVVSDLTVGHPRLAPEPLRGFGFNTEFKLRYDREEGVLNLERLLVSRDLFRATIRGDVRFDRTAFDLYLSIPKSACKHILQAVPGPLKTKLSKTVFDGTFLADVHLAIDETRPEETVLEAALDNRCRIASFGDIPEPDYFRGPFAYIAYTEKGDPLRLITGPGTDRWTPYRAVSPFLIEAVLTTEDGKFWNHTGITLPEVRRAIEINLKEGGMSHGASTITMQLAKNLFLTRERTVARKFQEMVFVWYLESYFTKEELLELYFNVVEFGPSLYGISDASIHYFGREPAELNALESVFLIKLLPNPVGRHKSYERGSISPRLKAQLQRLLRTMRDRRRLSEAELQEALAEEIVFHKEGTPFPEARLPAAHRLKGRAYSDDTLEEPFVDDGAF